MSSFKNVKLLDFTKEMVAFQALENSSSSSNDRREKVVSGQEQYGAPFGANFIREKDRSPAKSAGNRREIVTMARQTSDTTTLWKDFRPADVGVSGHFPHQ